jgi:putative FmdB family regulatory protein
MPLYEYICCECKDRFTLRMTIREYDNNESILCPKCKSKDLRRFYSAFTAVTSKKS